MTNPDTQPAQPTTGRGSGRAHHTLLLAIGLVLLLTGLTAWMWTGDWRWAVTGVAGLLAGLVLTAVTNPTDRS